MQILQLPNPNTNSYMGQRTLSFCTFVLKDRKTIWVAYKDILRYAKDQNF